jgi:hypothetical protein
LTLGHVHAAADQFIHALRGAGIALTLGGMDAVFDPEIDELADRRSHVACLTELAKGSKVRGELLRQSVRRRVPAR